MAWRLANSLDQLRKQVNSTWPNRSKASDGTIGDTAHSARASDHNPNSAGVVQALDITHDPAGGCDAGKLAELLRLSKDPRIKYIISNKRIAASYATNGALPWAWRPYAGTNPHNKHCHVSVMDDATYYDSIRPWGPDGLRAASDIAGPPPLPDATKVRQKMGRIILSYEYSGELKVHTATDGSKEIAGINNKYHAGVYDELYSKVMAGDQNGAYEIASEFVVDYTSQAAEWVKNGSTEFYLRDCIFNRGPTGAAIILQTALGVDIDGAVGPVTKQAAQKAQTADLLAKLRIAREAYERTLPVPGSTERRGPQWKLWNGMVSRWDKALKDAKQFEGFGSVIGGAVGGAVVVGGASAEAYRQGVPLDIIAPLGILGVLAVVGGILYFLRSRK